MIINNINQFKIDGVVELAPATNHVIQSISHKETGDLIIYTQFICASENSSKNNLVNFVKRHMHKDGMSIRKLLIITPSSVGCDYLKKVINENNFRNVSVYKTSVVTTNFIIEKKKVLFGAENFLEHSSTNSPSVTINDSRCRSTFIEYTKELLKISLPVVRNQFDNELFN